MIAAYYQRKKGFFVGHPSAEQTRKTSAGSRFSRKGDSLISIARRFLRVARANNSVSIVYYYSHKFSSARSTLPYLHFETGRFTARAEVPDHHAEVLARCHEFIISLGKPVVLSQILPVFAEAEPQLTAEIMAAANATGVYDQYMIPVFGPFAFDGVISFGFAETIPKDSRKMLRELEAAATLHHNQFVRYFASYEGDVDLSGRERDVLTWIARGKSKTEISTILGISVSSVDTYTRRVFEKMGVNSRVAAAIAGVTRGLVKP